MKKISLFLLMFFISMHFSCSKDKSPTDNDSKVIRWDFNTLDGWVDGSQNNAGPDNYEIIDGNLRIQTIPQSRDRAKVRTVEKIYSAGRYSWRIYIPALGIGDQCSIGAFLYSDDQHELDFEAGYGKLSDRNALNAQEDDLILFTTSQDSPYYSSKHLIKREQWHDFSLEISYKSETEKLYKVSWLVDDQVIDEQNLLYGNGTDFYIFCSVENLEFLGDHIPYQVNYALFDFAEYEP